MSLRSAQAITYQHTTPCPGSAKAQRRAARMSLLSSSLEACPGLSEATIQLRLDMDEIEYARLGKHVYIKFDPDAPADLKPPPPGFLAVSEDEMLSKFGIRTEDLEPRKSAFRAAMYRKDPEVWGESEKPAYAMAFRGSTLEMEDWLNNFQQNSNAESDYYRRAVRLGNSVAESKAINDIQMVGHSLGGGLASAAQGGSGSLASTFNSAMLHPETVKRDSRLADRTNAEAEKILAYHVDGEIVTTKQETGLTSLFSGPAVGIRKVVPPASANATPEDLHAMDEVIESIEAQKARNEAKLKTCLASKQNAQP